MRSWYERNSNANEPSRLGVKEYLVCFYEDGNCYDEARYAPEDLLKAITYLGFDNNRDDGEYCRVYVVFKDETVYELTAKEVDWKNV